MFILGSTANTEVSKELLHRNSNFIVLDEGKTGCRFIRKMMNYRDPRTGQPQINFVMSVQVIEDRFLSQEDKDFLLRILKSLAKGNFI